jgi:hypothetical protein
MQVVPSKESVAIEAVKKRFVRVLTEKGYPMIRDTVTGRLTGELGILLDYYKRCGGQNGLIENLRDSIPFAYDMAFIPGEDAITKNATGDNVLNLWLPPKIIYSKRHVSKEDVTLFLEFMERLFPDEVERSFFIWWLAHVIRRPEQRIIATPLLRSDTRTGKGFLIEAILQEILGEYSVGVCGPADVFGQFNDIVSGKIVLLIDEAQSIKSVAMQELKRMTGNSNLTLRLKGLGTKNVENHLNIILASNFEKPLGLESNDERFWIPTFIRHKISKDETNVFINERLKPWLMKDGLQQVRDYLETINLTDYKPTANAPMTISKKELLNIRSVTWETVLDEAIDQYPIITQNAVKAKLSSKNLTASEKAVGGYLKRRGCEKRYVNNKTIGVYLTPKGLASGCGATQLYREAYE